MNRAFLLALGAVVSVAAASAQGGGALQLAVDRALKPAPFKDVQASAQSGVVTLRGSVDVYRTKLDAETKVARVHGVRVIRDEIQVSGPAVSDTVLQSELARRVHSNTISVEVHHGIVELGGQHVDPLFALAAMSSAAGTPGVQGIVDRMAVSKWPATGPELGPMPYSVSSLP